MYLDWACGNHTPSASKGVAPRGPRGTPSQSSNHPSSTPAAAYEDHRLASRSGGGTSPSVIHGHGHSSASLTTHSRQLSPISPSATESILFPFMPLPTGSSNTTNSSYDTLPGLLAQLCSTSPWAFRTTLPYPPFCTSYLADSWASQKSARWTGSKSEVRLKLNHQQLRPCGTREANRRGRSATKEQEDAAPLHGALVLGGQDQRTASL